MSRNLESLLQDADPIRHEAPHLEVERERIRRAMLETVPAYRRGGSARASLAAVAALVVATVMAAVIGHQAWTHGTAPVLAAVRFEMRLAEEQPIHGSVAARVADSGRVIHLHPEIVVNNDDIAHATVTQDGPDRFGVAVQLLPPGAIRMRQATTSHVGRPVAILIDGIVVTAPVVRSPIDDSAVINGGYTRMEAERIANGVGGR